MLIDSILLYVRGGWFVLVDELYTMTHSIKVILLRQNNGEIKDINTEGGLMFHHLQLAWMPIKFLKLILSNVHTFTLKLGFKFDFSCERICTNVNQNSLYLNLTLPPKIYEKITNSKWNILQFYPTLAISYLKLLITLSTHAEVVELPHQVLVLFQLFLIMPYINERLEQLLWEYSEEEWLRIQWRIQDPVKHPRWSSWWK